MKFVGISPQDFLLGTRRGQNVSDLPGMVWFL